MTICSRGRFGRRLLTGLIVAVALATVHSQSSEQRVRPRTIVTTDPELDDTNSLVRFLLYAGEVETEGLIYASSQFHWRGDGKGTLFSMPDRVWGDGKQMVPGDIFD